MRFIIILLFFASCKWEKPPCDCPEDKIEAPVEKKEVIIEKPIKKEVNKEVKKEVKKKKPIKEKKEKIEIIPKKVWKNPKFCKDADMSLPEKKICKRLKLLKEERK